MRAVTLGLNLVQQSHHDHRAHAALVRGAIMSARNKYDLAVAYRIYPKVAKPALGLPFSDDKARLAEVCLQSFRRSLGNLRVRLWVLLDGCPPEYAAMFRRYFAEPDLELIPLGGIGNYGTFNRQIEILSQQNDSELVYFAEDDYFYLPDQFRSMLDFLQAHEDVDFVSPFDHLDCYSMELHHMPVWIRVFQGRHWRTAASTCLTFLTTRRSLRDTEWVMRTYAHRNYDCGVWLSLTKERVLAPWTWPRLARREPFTMKILAKAWFFGWRQILFGKKRRIWAPLPSIASHMDVKSLAPGMDWPTLMKEQSGLLPGDAADQV
jgi:hypothetical protein